MRRIALVGLVLAMALPTATATAGIIKQDTFTYYFPNAGDEPGSPTGEVTVVETQYDEEQTEELYDGMGTPGVIGQQAFVYEVTNVSWVPINGLNGLSGFNIPNEHNVDTVGNAFGPPGWDAFAGNSGDNTLPNPDNFEWDISDLVGPGILAPGGQGLFGFTVAAGYPDVRYGTGPWMHSWAGGGPTDVHYLDDISGPGPGIAITKELDSAVDGAGAPVEPEAVPLNTVVVFTMTITVTNPFAVPLTDIVVTDNFGGELEVLEVGGIAVVKPPGKNVSAAVGSDVTIDWTGKSDKAHMTWDVPVDLAPAGSTSLTVVVQTDVNPGQGAKAEAKNEYTSTGEHTLNSGATVTGTVDGTEIIAKSAMIRVNVVGEETDSGRQATHRANRRTRLYPSLTGADAPEGSTR